MLYELIDRTDNDDHDTGSKAEMLAFAAERNADEARHTTGKPRWTVKPEGYAAQNFKGTP